MRLIYAAVLAFRRVCGEPIRRLATLIGLTCPTHPSGQGRLRQRNIARRKLIFIFEESRTYAPINCSKKNNPKSLARNNLLEKSFIIPMKKEEV
jgi:hypothetical protein